MDNITLTPAQLVLVPVVAAILQLLKNVPVITKLTPYLPFAGIGISIALSFLTNMSAPWMSGILIGLVAAGGYDLIKGLAPQTPK